MKNETLEPGHPDQNKLSGSRPDENMSQVEIELNIANISAEPAGVGREKAEDTETTKNAEEFVEEWNISSPCYQPVIPGGHLHKSIKRTVERFMAENIVLFQHILDKLVKIDFAPLGLCSN